MEVKTEVQNEADARPSKKKFPRWALFLAGAALAIAVLAVGYVNGKLDLIRYHDGSVETAGTIDADEDQDLDGTGLAHSEDSMVMPTGSPFADDDVLNVLLISTDERTEAVNDWDAFTHLNRLDGTSATTEFSEDARADSLILVSLNIKENTIKLISIERGTGVPIDLPGYEDQYDWITHTFRYGGAKLTMETVEKCFSVKVDHYVRINFNSFVQIVDAVGGVDIELTELEAAALNWEVPSNSMLIVNKVDPGLNHFDGYTALQYARLRQIDNDWQRIVRQRTVIQAVLDQIKNASVLELNSLLDTALPLVQTNFTKAEIAALLVQLPAFLGVQTEQMSLPAEGTYGVRTGMDDRLMYDPDWEANSRLMQRFLYGVTSDDAMAGYFQDSCDAVDLAYPLTDEDFGEGGYAVYLAGELPGAEKNAAAKRALLRYLHEHQGVNVFAVGGSFAGGVLLDDYLSTGRRSSLQAYLDTLHLEEDALAEEETFCQWLYSYACAQTQGNDIRAVGLAPAGAAEALPALALLLDPSANLNEEMQALAARIRAGEEDAVEALNTALDAHFYAAKKLFGSSWPTAKQLLKNLTAADGAERDAMADNLRWALDQAPGAALFAQLESREVVQTACQWEGEPADGLAVQLAADGTLAGKVCSILLLYPDDGARQYAALAAESPLAAYWPDALTQDSLVSLDGTASPYEARNGFFADPEADARPVLNYFQKLLILTDGNARRGEESAPDA